MTTNHIELAFQLTDGSRMTCDAQACIESSPLASSEVILLDDIAVNVALELTFEEKVDTGGDCDSTCCHGDSICRVVWIDIDAREVLSPSYLHV